MQDIVMGGDYRLGVMKMENSMNFMKNIILLKKMRNSVANSGAAFALSGLFIRPYINDGVYGDYWSSTSSSSGYMYGLRVQTSWIYDYYSDGQSVGKAIRCISNE